jgi:hypothetical protein
LSPGELFGRRDCRRWAGQHGAFFDNGFGNTSGSISDFRFFALTLGFIARVNREKTERTANNGGRCDNRSRSRSSRQLCTGTGTSNPNNLPRFDVTRNGTSGFAVAFFALRLEPRFLKAIA